MSPQVMNFEEYGKGADIWSVGLIFYNILALEEPMLNPKLRPIGFQKLELSDIPQGFCPRGFTLFKCIYIKMIVFDEKDRATVEQVIDDEAFHGHYQTVEAQALVWQVDDLQEKNQFLEDQRREEQVQIKELKLKLEEQIDEQKRLQSVRFHHFTRPRFYLVFNSSC